MVVVVHLVALPAAGVGGQGRYSIGILDGYVAGSGRLGVWEGVRGLVGWMVDCLVGWMVWCLVGWWFERSVDWMVMG